MSSYEEMVRLAKYKILQLVKLNITIENVREYFPITLNQEGIHVINYGKGSWDPTDWNAGFENLLTIGFRRLGASEEDKYTKQGFVHVFVPIMRTLMPIGECTFSESQILITNFLFELLKNERMFLLFASKLYNDDYNSFENPRGYNLLYIPNSVRSVVSWRPSQCCDRIKKDIEEFEYGTFMKVNGRIWYDNPRENIRNIDTLIRNFLQDFRSKNEL